MAIPLIPIDFYNPVHEHRFNCNTIACMDGHMDSIIDIPSTEGIECIILTIMLYILYNPDLQKKPIEYNKAMNIVKSINMVKAITIILDPV